MHEEFRVRTVCELVLHQDYYLQPHIVSHLDATGTLNSKNILPATSASFERASQLSIELNISLAKCCFQEDCKESAKLGVYSNMWHIHGIASVLRHPVMSIYPDVNSRIRPFYNKLVRPRVHSLQQNTPSAPLTIMWTRTCPMTGDQPLWSPNHFVPCIQCQSPTGSIEEVISNKTFLHTGLIDLTHWQVAQPPVLTPEKVFHK